MLKIFLIVGLIKLLLETDKPLLCAGIYAAGSFGLGMAFGNAVEVMLIVGLVSFVLAFIYFWLLSKFEDAGLVWWLIMLGGLVIGLV